MEYKHLTVHLLLFLDKWLDQTYLNVGYDHYWCTTLFCLISAAHYNFPRENLVWVFSFAYVDQNSRQGKYYKTPNAN